MKSKKPNHDQELADLHAHMTDVWEVLEALSKRIIELSDSVNANSLLLASLSRWIAGEAEHEC